MEIIPREGRSKSGESKEGGKEERRNGGEVNTAWGNIIYVLTTLKRLKRANWPTAGKMKISVVYWQGKSGVGEREKHKKKNKSTLQLAGSMPGQNVQSRRPLILFYRGGNKRDKKQRRKARERNRGPPQFP